LLAPPPAPFAALLEPPEPLLLALEFVSPPLPFPPEAELEFELEFDLELASEPPPPPALLAPPLPSNTGALAVLPPHAHSTNPSSPNPTP
jgi:hypothetical protein